MRLDVGPLDAGSNVPTERECRACHGRARRQTSAWQGEGVIYHHYRCRADGCPAGGTIVEHPDGSKHRVGPVFGDHDLAVRLATRERPEVPAEAQEVHA